MGVTVFLNFKVNIEPVGQMRARHGAFKRGGKVISKTYKHETQEEREESLAALLAKHVPPQPFSGPLALKVRAVFSIPQSWSQKKKLQAFNGEIRPTKRPDLDNIIKHIKDVMTNLRFWTDDALIVEYMPGTGKFYGVDPYVEITITKAEEPAW